MHIPREPRIIKRTLWSPTIQWKDFGMSRRKQDKPQHVASHEDSPAVETDNTVLDSEVQDVISNTRSSPQLTSSQSIVQGKFERVK